MSEAATPALTRVGWQPTWRLVPSRFPPIDLFERVADPRDFDALAELEMLTNPRLRQEWGEISLVPAARRISGPGASWAMAPFVHPNPLGSRFSDGAYGLYYASESRATAVAETAYHMGRFYAETADPPHREDMRALLGRIDAALHDLRHDPAWAPMHDPDNYTPSQQLGARLREAESNGIVYRSVRRVGGECIAAFWPDVVGAPLQGPHLQYEWDGIRIRRFYDYAAESWIEIEPAA